MKKSLLLLLFLAALSLAGADANLVPAPFKGWYISPGGNITAAGEIITISGKTNAKAKAYQKAQVLIPFKVGDLPGKRVELSFKYRAPKLGGAVQVALRQVSGKEGTYHGFRLRKWDTSPDWQERKHTFTTGKNARQLYFYLVGFFLDEDDKLEIKDLKVTIQ